MMRPQKNGDAKTICTKTKFKYLTITFHILRTSNKQKHLRSPAEWFQATINGTPLFNHAYSPWQ